jgi:UDP-N-acetylmuramate--alanine ligase
VIVAPVYAAGETPIKGVDRDALAAGLRARGHRQVLTIDHEDDLARLVLQAAGAGDMVVCLGAGTITQWAQALPGRLDELASPGRDAAGAS